MNLSVIIPVYNSESSLRPLHDRLSASLPSIADEYEIVFVNDGSRDGSWQILEELAHSDHRVRTFDMMRNYGQHNALLCGIRAAQYDTIVTIDDDLQHPPEEIPKLLDRLQQGADVVYGTPEHEQHDFLRNLASMATKISMRSAMGVSMAQDVSAFRAFRTSLRDAFASYHSMYVCIDVLLAWGTTRFDAVTVRHEPREYGRSQYTFTKLCIHAVNMITGFSVLPLRLASMTGFFFTLIGFGVLVYILLLYFIYHASPAGFPFLASIIAIFAGVQLFALGIIGEYMARMHYRLMDRPPYTVRKQCEEGAGRDG